MQGKLKYFLWSASSGRLRGDPWLISDLASRGSSYPGLLLLLLHFDPRPRAPEFTTPILHYLFQNFSFSHVSLLVHQLVVLTQKGLWMYEWGHCYYSSVALTHDSLSVFYGWRRLCESFVSSFGGLQQPQLHLKPSAGLISPVSPFVLSSCVNVGTWKCFSTSLDTKADSSQEAHMASCWELTWYDRYKTCLTASLMLPSSKTSISAPVSGNFLVKNKSKSKAVLIRSPIYSGSYSQVCHRFHVQMFFPLVSP